MVQRTDLRNNTAAGLVARNGALVDAGQTSGTDNFTGLGVDAGQNDFSAGYAAGGAQAIVDENTGPGYDRAGPGRPRPATP